MSLPLDARFQDPHTENRIEKLDFLLKNNHVGKYAKNQLKTAKTINLRSRKSPAVRHRLKAIFGFKIR